MRECGRAAPPNAVAASCVAAAPAACSDAAQHQLHSTPQSNGRPVCLRPALQRARACWALVAIVWQEPRRAAFAASPGTRAVIGGRIPRSQPRTRNAPAATHTIAPNRRAATCPGQAGASGLGYMGNRVGDMPHSHGRPGVTRDQLRHRASAGSRLHQAGPGERETRFPVGPSQGGSARVGAGTTRKIDTIADRVTPVATVGKRPRPPPDTGPDTPLSPHEGASLRDNGATCKARCHPWLAAPLPRPTASRPGHGRCKHTRTALGG